MYQLKACITACATALVVRFFSGLVRSWVNFIASFVYNIASRAIYIDVVSTKIVVPASAAVCGDAYRDHR